MAHSNSSSLPTNEEIIDEITRNVATKVTLENQGKDSQNDYNKVPSDFEVSDSEEQLPTVPDDFVDEEQLKILENELSEEQKLENHQLALNSKTKGNVEFKNEKYQESIVFYTEGLRVCPLQFSSDRSVLYANRAASKVKLDRKESAIEDCTKAIELNDVYLKAYLRRAKLYEDTDKLDLSLADYNKVIDLDPGNGEARAAQARLTPIINERNEKLKGEMMDKLKDLGNTILRPFGLSTENFQLIQDPNTGGYSVNFTQNRN